METPIKPVSTFSIALPWGLVFGLYSGLTFVLWEAKVPIEEAARRGNGGLGTVLGWALALALVIVAHLQFKKKGDGFMSYGQGLTTALWAGLVGGILSAVIRFVYMKFIDPEYLAQMKEFALNQATKANSTEEGEQMAEKIMGFFMSPGMMSFLKCLSILFLYLIYGLIVSIFTKKESAAAPF
jgi:hypothetical protein